MSDFASAFAIRDMDFAQQKANAELQQIILDAIDRSVKQNQNMAKDIAYAIYDEVVEFQKSLPSNTDVAIQLVTFGSSSTLLVDTIGYKGGNLIVFRGKDNSGKPLELIQHIHQLNFLLKVAQPPQQPAPPKRKIGFAAA